MKTNEELLNIAKEASKKAYCPYSKFPVGASILYESGNVYVGCNVENSSFGLSLCAERNAISSAIAFGENSKILKIAIYSPKSKKCYPCGACRQVMVELLPVDCKIYIAYGKELNIVETSLKELVPFAFSSEDLQNA